MNNYNKLIQLVKSDIDIINKNLISNIEIQEPLCSAVKKFLSLPAKRIRPLVALLYLKAYNLEITTQHLKLLTAIELVHNASLIHDDVIDDATLRRAKKTLNTEFNPKIAVITGDYLLAVAMNYINELNNPAILQEFSATLADMCKGEISQFNNLHKIPTLEEYLLKTECKTASLFATTLKCIAIISNINQEKAVAFAKNFGIAFQIKDDLNNFLTTQTDVNSGIYTAPIVLSGSKEKPAIEKTRCLLNNYIDLALKSIASVEENTYKRALAELTEMYRNE